MSIMTARRLWMNIHLYIALTFGVVLVVVAVSGSLLVWHDAVDRVLEPQRYAVAGDVIAQSPEAYLRAGASALADIKPTMLRMPEHAGDPVTVAGPLPQLGLNGRPEMQTVWIDPETGLVLDVGNVSKSFTSIVHSLHGRLLIPEIGRQLVGWMGVFMLVLSLSGIYLWWPRGGITFRRALGWRKALKTSANLHQVSGIWIAIPLALLSFTGIYISFPQTSRATLGLFVDVGPQQSGGAPVRAPGRVPMGMPMKDVMLSIGEAVTKASAEAKGAQLLAVTLPTDKSPEWRVQFKGSDGTAPLTVTVDDRSGTVKAAKTDKKPDVAQSTQRLMRQIHDGTDMGIVWQVIIFIGGILPLLFMITGVMMWLRRRSFERDRDQKRAAAVAARSTS